jgi:tetratricopeptide (TPR) repeat protein
MKGHLLFGLIYFLFTVAAISGPYEERLKKGDDYYNEFDNKSAIQNYLNAYKIDSTNYNVLFRLARTYNDLGEEYHNYREKDSSEIMINRAIEFSTRMMNYFPDSAATYAYLAMSYGNLALFKGGNEKIKLAYKIEENAKKSLQINPDQYLAYVILGIYNRQIAKLSWFERMFANTFYGNVPEGSFEESVRMLKKALEVNPNTIVATFQLALTYKAMKDKKNETELLKKLFNYPQKNFRDKFAIKKAKQLLKDME